MRAKASARVVPLRETAGDNQCQMEDIIYRCQPPVIKDNQQPSRSALWMYIMKESSDDFW